MRRRPLGPRTPAAETSGATRSADKRYATGDAVTTGLRHEDRIRDLRGGAARHLVYPPGCVLVVAGVPGAGKTTLLHRLYALTGQDRAPVRTSGGVLVLDSEQARKRWQARLHPIPYRYWRPLVHLTHYLWLWRAIGRDGPLVLHECGTRSRLFAAVVRRVTRQGRQVHVILLDVPAATAHDGARSRPRPLNLAGFRRHAARWARLLTRLDREPDRVLPGVCSITVLDRAAADRLTALRFSPAPTPPPAGA
jgi:hypothetical protein